MAQCPNCSASVPDDFGLTECTSCQAQLLVHIDGTVEYSGAGSDEARPTPPYAVTTADEVPIEDLFADEEQSAEPEYEAPAFAESDYEEPAYESAEDAVDELSAPDPESEAESEFESEFESEPEPEPNPEPEAEYDFDAPEPDAPPDPLAIPLPVNEGNGSPDLSDIAQFGNSDASGGRDGALRYNVFVSGIDTSDVRDAFREALTDRKFVWDIDQILRSIRDGECQIANVTAVKAHVLIARLRQMQVEVEWEQYAIHQA